MILEGNVLYFLSIVSSQVSSNTPTEHQTQTHKLPARIPKPLKPRHLRPLFFGFVIPVPALRIHLRLPRNQICLGRLHKFRLLDHLPEHEHHSGKCDSKVTGHETLDVEGLEGVEAGEEDDDAAGSDGEVCCIWHEWCVPMQRAAVDALCSERPVPADEGGEEACIGQNEANRGQVDEPSKDSNGRATRNHESQTSNKRRQTNTVYRNSRFCASPEHLWRLSVECEGVKSSRSTVHVRVSATPS